MAIITGDTGADTLYDTADSDTIEARAGNDRITLSLGGNDTVSPVWALIRW
jgi:Ca2+-binding RTX toxin-like protein